MSIDIQNLSASADLQRSGRAVSFEDRLRASIHRIGLVEPLKIAIAPAGGYVVVDGHYRLRAIERIREVEPDRFQKVPAYLVPYDARYEIRLQSDIYQDLLPSQMATLVEHLHTAENVNKADIASYIGVSPATLRNYTGLSRLLTRGVAFSRVVDLMDAGVIPASNPYAWLRLTENGLDLALRQSFTGGSDPDLWVREVIDLARSENPVKYSLKYVESATHALPPECYREVQEVRAAKRELGLRKRSPQNAAANTRARAVDILSEVQSASSSAVLISAAASLKDFIK